ncbi:MAG TPA: SdrD B-like domain-containing protein, partial [Gemmataceae bacterium]|nr:SdrD B-like domain-containing protein [Gemmataceae bacterium]
ANAQLEVVYHYIPSNAIKPGNYTIVQTNVPPGYLQGKTSSNGTVLPPNGPPPSIPVVFTGNNSPNNDFGELTPGSLSGSVYVDTNNDGIRETNEAGIGGVTITLTPTSGSSGVVSILTAADGTYQFNNLLPGVYAIQETQPTNYLEGKNTVGSLGGTVTADLFSSITVPVGGAGINYNFGELLASSLAGKVYVDANDNGVLDPSEAGIAAVTLTLSGTNDLGNAVNATTTTGSDGTYSFNGLRPGTYTIVETQPANYLDGKTTAGSAGGIAGINQISSIALASAINGVSYNFGEISNGTLSGKVYVDNNDNGVLDPGEPGIASVTLTLTGTNDLGTAISLTTATAADGTYSFYNLRPGTYTIVDTPPANYFTGKTTAGTDGGSPGVNKISSFTLPPSATATGYNFGEIPPSSLAGNVYVDNNNNGIEDPGEQGIGDVTITLTGVNDQNISVSATTVTAPNGTYSFTGLRPGVYGITETQPTAYNPGKLTLGSLGGQTANDQFLSVSVQPGQNGVQYNFGELILIKNSSGNNPFTPININLTFLSKLQLLSNSQQILQEATQLAYYVDGVYSITLGRHADTAALSYFTLQLLEGGMSQQAFVSFMLSTPEHMASEINSSYLTILGRPADAGGLAYFEGLMNSGVSIDDINATLLTSPEFQARFSSNQAFVQGLYQAVLGRAPSAADLSFWQAQLTGGTQRLMLAEEILHSTESIADEIKLDYLNILGRQADTASLNAWVSMIQNGQMTEPQVATALMCSTEFFDRVMAAAGL